MVLKIDRLNSLTQNHLDFAKHILVHQNRLLSESKRHPIDVQYTQRCVGAEFARLQREIILKGIVIDIVEKVRMAKSKPKLADFLRSQLTTPKHRNLATSSSPTHTPTQTEDDGTSATFTPPEDYSM